MKSLFGFVILVTMWSGHALAESKFESQVGLVDDFLAQHCVECHYEDKSSGGLNLESLSLDSLVVDGGMNAGGDERAVWETIFRRLQARQMPPAEADSRPEPAEYDSFIAALVKLLDHKTAKSNNKLDDDAQPMSIRRLTRWQYENAIRDLLGIKVDATRWLPPDSVSDGFDNITVDDLSPLLMNRYLRAAAEISRVAIGRPQGGLDSVTIRVPPDRTQSHHVDGLPLGTRGGVWFEHFVSRRGEYQFQLRLSRDRDELVEGLFRKHDLDILVDDLPVHRFEVKPPKDKRDQASIDRHLKIQLPLEPGHHRIGVTFVSQGSPLSENKRKPFDARFNRHRHPRGQPAIYEVSVVGPMGGELAAIRQETIETGLPHEMPFSLRELKDVSNVAVARDEAEKKLVGLLRVAYRREVDANDRQIPMQFFDDSFQREHKKNNDITAAYQAGMEAALATILVNPHFLLRVEADLASRMSFFLWGSLPDQKLLDLQQTDQLSKPKVLSGEVHRMLADTRSSTLTDDFVSQWLYLRNLKSTSPNLRAFPDFDDNLRLAFEEETKQLFRFVVENDRSIFDLVRPGRMFLNERLARHYGIPGVIGSEFREVKLNEVTPGGGSTLPPALKRGGLLRHGSILMLTSYATRTSPTVRGSWVLENLFGTPPPPPPPNVPALKEKNTLVSLSVRERLAEHRANPACASCHDRIDPLGFAMEQYDALGRYRVLDNEQPVDAAGYSPDGREIDSVDGLEDSLLRHKDVFATTLTEKLMTFALGRKISHDDAGAIRKIVRDASQHNYRFSSLIRGIVASDSFQSNR